MYFQNPVEGRIILTRSHTDEKLENGHPLFRVTNPFDGKNGATGGRHNALDLGNFNPYDAVYTIADGVARTMVDSAGANIVIVKHEDGYESVYAHLDSFTIATGKSVPVSTGQQIGRVGSTGISSGPHLHFEIKKDGKHIDPWPLLNQKPQTFSDVPSSHRFYDAIEWAGREKLIVGIDGEYRPDGLVTRGQLAVILNRLDRRYR